MTILSPCLPPTVHHQQDWLSIPCPGSQCFIHFLTSLLHIYVWYKCIWFWFWHKCTWVWSPAPNWSEKAEASLCLPACQREPLDLTGICILHSVRGARWSSIQYLLCDYFSPPRMSKTFPLRARRLSSRTLPWTSQLLSLGTSQFHLQGWRWKQNALWQKKSFSSWRPERNISF